MTTTKASKKTGSVSQSDIADVLAGFREGVHCLYVTIYGDFDHNNPPTHEKKAFVHTALVTLNKALRNFSHIVTELYCTTGTMAGRYTRPFDMRLLSAQRNVLEDELRRAEKAGYEFLQQRTVAS